MVVTVEVVVEIDADLLRAEVVIEEIDPPPPPPFRSPSSTLLFIAAASTIFCSTTIFLVSVPTTIVRLPMSTRDQRIYDSKLSVDGLKKETTLAL